jgi:hypothetical protein
MDNSQIFLEISECFKGTNVSGEEHLIQNECLNIYEAQEVERAFKKLNWDFVNPEILLKNKAALNYFTDEAFVYYLPAYMKLILSDFEQADVLVDILLDKLTLPAGADIQIEYLDYRKDEMKLVDLREYYITKLAKIDDHIHGFIKRTSLLSTRQSHCVLKFLAYLEDHFSGFFANNELRRAINRYWFIYQDKDPD